MRKTASVIVGIAAALLIVLAIEFIGSALYPVTLDIQSADPATLARVIGEMPLLAKMIVASGWLLGSLGGAWLALRIADWRQAGWIVALVILFGSIVNQFQLPHPLWMQVCAGVFPLLGGWLAQRLHYKPYPGEPLLG